MTIKSINNSAANLDPIKPATTALHQETETTNNLNNLNRSADTNIFTPKNNVGHQERLLQQFTRARMSLGSTTRQGQIATLLNQQSPKLEELNKGLHQIRTAASFTDEERRTRTERTIGLSQKTIDKGSDAERAAISGSINRASQGLVGKTSNDLPIINKLLDTFNQVTELLHSVMDILNVQKSVPASLISEKNLTANEVDQFKAKVKANEFSVAVLPGDKDAEAQGIKNFYEIEPGLLRGAVPMNAQGYAWLHNQKKVTTEIDFQMPNEFPYGSMKDKWAADAGIERIAIPLPDVGTPNGEQLNKFFDAVDTVHKKQGGNSNSTDNLFIHCRAGHYRTGTMVGLMRVREGMTGDQAVAEAVNHGLNPEYILKSNGNHASEEVDFIQKFGDLYHQLQIKPGSSQEKEFNQAFTTSWNANKSASRAEFVQKFATDWVKAHQPPPPPLPPSPTGDVAVAKQRLSELGFTKATVKQITDSAALRLVALNDSLLKDISKQNATNERAFARKIDGLAADLFVVLKGLSLPEQKRVANLSSQQMIDELKKITPPPPPPPPPSNNMNLLLGNPTDATNNVNNANNYLMEKPQYVLSYNRDKGEPNWVSWHLENEDFGSSGRAGNFSPDTSLPTGWYQVTPDDYSGSGYTRGHMTPSGDRTKSVTDNQAVFLMTNMIPQTAANNNGPWNGFENYCRDLAKQGQELYIISGGYGLKGKIADGKVDVPERTWKVAVVLPKGENDLARINENTRVIAIDMPNSNDIVKDDWKKYRTSVDAIEKATGYNFLSNVSNVIQNAVEARVDSL